MLARKYRPQTFAELIGQDAMVKTLANAIARDRMAHAFLMTGVRGVGKTSTARLIAKALNCIGPDGQGGPTIDPCGVCEPCLAIAEGRHIDVIEMDAASHTGVDDVREIIEAVRYAAVSARYKIYIIDEVHMLSSNAFNALLKTLEEPPAHVKFLFATTEVDKLPVTVLSRCQRFDLRRIPADKLAEHFAASRTRRRRGRARSPGDDRPGRRRLGPRRPVDPRPGDRASAAERSPPTRCATCSASPTRPDPPPARSAAGGRRAAGAGRIGRVACARHRSRALLRGLMEDCMRHPVPRPARADRAQSAEERQSAEEMAGKLSLGRHPPAVAAAAQGPRRRPARARSAGSRDMALLRLIHAADLPDPAELIARWSAEGRAPLQNRRRAPNRPRKPHHRACRRISSRW